MLKFKSLRPDVQEYLREISDALRENKSTRGTAYIKGKSGVPDLYYSIRFKTESEESTTAIFSGDTLDNLVDEDRELVEGFKKDGYEYFIVGAGTLK